MAAASFPLTPMGHKMREHFLFDPHFINLNHGSFGTYPTQVRTALHEQQALAEARPDNYLRYTYNTVLEKARAAISTYLNVPKSTCVFVSNATTGVNLVLRNIVYEPNDVIVYFDTIYGACEKTVFSVSEYTGVKSRKVQYEFGVHSHEEIVKRFEEVVKQIEAEGLKAKVAVFETIVSMPGVRFPFEKMVKKAKELGVLSCVDGAHGVGQIKLDMAALNPDFFVSNCHKWLYTPRGSAVFYVPERNQALIRTTLPTSHGFVPRLDQKAHNPLPASPSSSTAFENLFAFVATVDSGPYTCVPAALQFRKEVCGGEDKIFQYITEIVNAGAEHVAKVLGTEVLSTDPAKGAQDELRQCALVNVRLPLDPTKLGPAFHFIVETTMREFDSYIPCVEYKGHLWARFSGQVYLEMSDFEFAAKMLKGLCEKFEAGVFEVGDLKKELGRLAVSEIEKSG